MSKFFADIATITLRSGKGGNGAVSFRREKFVPRGGPDGGDGGDGGNVILCASGDERTLRNLRMYNILSAEHGQNGAGMNRHGKRGKDIVLDVPVGAVIKDEYGVQIAQLVTEKEEIIVLRGGRGGKGNAFFKSSVRQAPKFAQNGEEGVELCITVELELIADWGFVGIPNAGKSTLLKTLTQANPKIDNYPFTTLVPNLGTLKNFEREIILADIPGLIEGASEGAGLGFEFLKHIKKTLGLVFVLDLYIGDIDDLTDVEENTDMNNFFLRRTAEYVSNQYRMLIHELMTYEKELIHKTKLIVMSKADISLFAETDEKFDELIAMLGEYIVDIHKELDIQMNEGIGTTVQLLCISSLTSKNIGTLKKKLFEELPKR